MDTSTVPRFCQKQVFFKYNKKQFSKFIIKNNLALKVHVYFQTSQDTGLKKDNKCKRKSHNKYW